MKKNFYLYTHLLNLRGAANQVLARKNPADDELLAKHAEWVRSFADQYDFATEDVTEILHREIGKTFEGVLEDAGVYKCTKDGREAFLRFIDAVNR